MSEHPHEDQADKLEREADQLEERSDELKSDIAETREDWENKVRDDSVPGTPPAPKDDEPQGPEKARA
jgi:hypothetical protein